MTKKIYLVPDISEQQNIYMYCNYARRNPHEERCFKCENDCKHKGKHTILIEEKIDENERDCNAAEKLARYERLEEQAADLVQDSWKKEYR